ncbi:redoxin domain-containing protein [Spongiimicrobium salis]|uniref:redoxin domain-containing protein n=1 Tax=Spongiimicrobium salis TaxID=1667022 RepID=UPI00374C91AF
MKKFALIISAVLILAACNTSTEGFTVNGTLSGEVKDSTKIFLRKTDSLNKLVEVDTTVIKDGKYEFTGIADSPEVYFVFVDQLPGNIPFILENGDITIKAQKDSLFFAKLSGTPQNEIFAGFLKETRERAQKGQSISVDIQRASAEKNQDKLIALRDEYFELQQEAKDFEADFIKKNPNALIAAFLIDRALSGKLLPENEVRELYEALTPEIKQTSIGKALKGKLDKTKSTSIGSKAPNFSAPTPEGEPLALNDVLGKVTIVDFWAAWCRPCRVENPNVVRIYNEYHDKGLNIMGVSLDRRAEDWKKAILDDGLTWNHVSNVDYFDEIARLYNVNAIPATFILDEKGVIVAKDLRGDALEEKIASMLQ